MSIRPSDLIRKVVNPVHVAPHAEGQRAAFLFAQQIVRGLSSLWLRECLNEYVGLSGAAPINLRLSHEARREHECHNAYTRNHLGSTTKDARNAANFRHSLLGITRGATTQHVRKKISGYSPAVCLPVLCKWITAAHCRLSRVKARCTIR